MTTDDGRLRPYDPKPPKAPVSLGDYVGHVVGFFGCGDYEEAAPNPQFDNREFVPVGTFAVFAKPATDGPVEVVTDWKCFNSRLRRQIVTEPAVVGLLQGQGRAGSPYEVVGLPNTERANEAYEFVLETATKQGWVSAKPKPAADVTRRVDEDEGF